MIPLVGMVVIGGSLALFLGGIGIQRINDAICPSNCLLSAVEAGDLPSVAYGGRYPEFLTACIPRILTARSFKVGGGLLFGFFHIIHQLLGCGRLSLR
jgi:hypothetical protein